MGKSGCSSRFCSVLLANVPNASKPLVDRSASLSGSSGNIFFDKSLKAIALPEHFSIKSSKGPKPVKRAVMYCLISIRLFSFSSKTGGAIQSSLDATELFSNNIRERLLSFGRKIHYFQSVFIVSLFKTYRTNFESG